MTCETCFKGFLKDRHVKIHLCTRKEKTLAPKLSSKRFSQISDLIKHLFVYTKGTSFVCGIYLKGVSHEGNLENHMHTHRIEKNFVWENCFKRYSRGALTFP